MQMVYLELSQTPVEFHLPFPVLLAVVGDAFVNALIVNLLLYNPLQPSMVIDGNGYSKSSGDLTIRFYYIYKNSEDRQTWVTWD